MRVLMSLGTNLGDRAANLKDALKAVKRVPGTRLLAVSAVYETEPVGKTDQPEFLNLAVEIETELSPLELLDAVQAIEDGLGRVRMEKWGPRPIDIDLILWGLRTLTSLRLTLPHPEFRKRAFVLVPLAEIAPESVDPVTGLTIAQLSARSEAKGRVTRLGSLSRERAGERGSC
ncbi:MAG: 2-amino-4-hydroxy-6-hydroxymethyldihydropteridine diphosphokinase [FCB group bacterium]|jgi:2-amino-4-hydroxy-6-hydroxymethyldihydropteridine diphosphokinase|nr:2-amino-4-hydroxy-6-hydroxymethyldihydropteridine diphosphokinase [FCB group bacterium]